MSVNKESGSGEVATPRLTPGTPSREGAQQLPEQSCTQWDLRGP